MSSLGDKGFEDPVFHHALDGAHRQAQQLGRLAGAEIGSLDVAVFHREFLEKEPRQLRLKVGVVGCYDPLDCCCAV